MSSEVPIGFLISLSQDMEAMERFMRLSPAARDALVQKARHAHSREEMDSIIRGI